MEQYKLLKDLVKFNTIKDKQNQGIIEYIENYLKKLGFKTEYKTKNLVMSIGENPKLGFLGHTDTVEYIEDFKNPFELTLKNGYLYGLGVCDMKGGIAAMLDAVSQIDFNKIKNGIKLYFTYDEEIGFSGVNELVKNGNSFPEFMIFGEPTNNEIFTGHKGLIEYEIYFNGIKAHSSNPSKGISANMNMVKFLSQLDKFYNENIKIDEENQYEIPYTTMNVGTINGGSAKNSVPAFCKISIDFRIANKKHIKIITNKVEELAKKYRAEVNIIELIEPFYDEISFLGKTKTTNFMTEASKIYDSKRIILGTGPVTAHEVNENISTNSYNKLINQYKKLIYQICS
ncbi:MAG: M20/M25/M40 family metallo-hydrolase [Clostridia bacterium]|nr:M20/M25/M40 family metallo-hydrolase [Clostridia bacterium]